MSISIIYRVSHTLPDALTVFLEDHGDINRKFEVQIMQDQKGNVSAGANSYSDREEWAEFNDKMQAEACDKAMRRTIATFHTLAIS